MKIVYDDLAEFAMVVEKCTICRDCDCCALSPICKDNDEIQNCAIVKCGEIKRDYNGGV